MMEINNLTRIRLDEKTLRKAAKEVLRGERKSKAELSVVFANPAKIRELNKKYRKKNCPTDVLTYIYDKSSGEIMICPQIVKKNAKEFGSTFKKEMIRVLTHGVLHFLGYDHEKGGQKAKKMKKKEELYLYKTLNTK
ncbi:MAG: rRNA maturation RNase YbeY [Patescibacteria group bacterium]